jgi:hypothetical protein
LEAQLLADKAKIPEIAGLDEKVKISGTNESDRTRYHWSKEVTWAEIFAAIAPYLLEPLTEDAVTHKFESFFGVRGKEYGGPMQNVSIHDQDLRTIKVQLLALRLVAVESRPITVAYYTSIWTLTEKGEDLMFQLRTVKTTKPS